MATRVVRGSLWTLGGQSFSVLSSLIATPFVLRALGTESFGVLALINVLIAYLASSALGMGMASTRFGAEAYSRGDQEQEAGFIWTALLIAAIAAGCGAISLAVLAEPLIRGVFQVPSHLHEQTIVALRLAGIVVFARAISSVVNTPQLARLRMDLFSFINSAASIGQNLLIPVFLFLGGNLVTAVSVIVAVSAATTLSNAIVSWRLLPRLFKPGIRPKLVPPLLRFGGGLVSSTVAGLILEHGEKLFLIHFVSVTTLAYYAIAFTLAGSLALVPAAMRQSLFPAFSRLQAEKDRDSLKLLYVRALRGTLLWIAPAALVLCALAKPFLTFWAGSEYGMESSLPFYILVGGLMFNAMAFVPHALMIGLGRSDLIARIHLSEVLPYLLCAGALTYWLGAPGAALAWSLRVIADALLFFMAARRIAGLEFSSFPIKQRGYALAVAALVLPVLLTIGISSSVALLIGVTALSSVIYGGVIWKQVLTDGERAWVSDMLLLRSRRAFEMSL